MTNKIIRVTATGLIVALVMAGYTAQAEEITVRDEVKAVRFDSCNTEKVDIPDIKIVEYNGIKDIKHTNYVYNSDIIEINTDHEIIESLDKSEKEEIQLSEVERVYDSVDFELDLFDEESNPVATVMITDDNRLLLEEYNVYTKLSKYSEVYNDNLVKTLRAKTKMNL